MPSKQELVDEYMKNILGCIEILAFPKKEHPDSLRIVKRNMDSMVVWVEFLQRSDTPELGW